MTLGHEARRVRLDDIGTPVSRMAGRRRVDRRSLPACRRNCPDDFDEVDPLINEGDAPTQGLAQLPESTATGTGGAPSGERAFERECCFGFEAP